MSAISSYSRRTDASSAKKAGSRGTGATTGTIRSLMAGLRGDAREVGLDPLLRAQLQDRRLQGFLPQQRLHGDVQRMILDGERHEALVARGVVVHRPARRGEMQVALLPLDFLAVDHALAI